MLKVPAEFPYPGATAYVAPHGEAVRIIQRLPDGVIVAARQRPGPEADASDTFRVEPDAYFATEAEAIGIKPRRRRRAG